LELLSPAIACPGGLGQGNRRYQIAKSTFVDFQPTKVGFALLLVQFELPRTSRLRGIKYLEKVRVNTYLSL
jgi:hypothetical protein